MTLSLVAALFYSFKVETYLIVSFAREKVTCNLQDSALVLLLSDSLGVKLSVFAGNKEKPIRLKLN